MSDRTIAGLAWIGLALHLIAGTAALRQVELRHLVPALNLVTAAFVVLYWCYKWYSYLFRGVSWYASDQLIPLYAIAVCVLAIGTLASRFSAPALNWIAFAIHTLACIAAVLFFAFFKMKMF